VRVVWVLGLLGGVVAGVSALADVPLLVKLLVGLAVVVIGVAGPFGSVMLAGLLVGAGLLTFVVLLATSERTGIASPIGVTEIGV
jgi:hypothetical protein